MPLYRVHITSSDGAIDCPDVEGIELTGIGEARALVIETLLECARERVPAGSTRAISITACDERGAVVYGDEVTVRAPEVSSETRDLWRAMAAMNA